MRGNYFFVRNIVASEKVDCTHVQPAVHRMVDSLDMTCFGRSDL